MYTFILVPTDRLSDFNCRWHPQPSILFPSQVIIFCKSGRGDGFAVVLMLLAAWHTDLIQRVDALLPSAISATARVSHLGLVNTNIQGALAFLLNFCGRICQSVSIRAPLSAGFRTEGRWRALHLQSKNSTGSPGFIKLHCQKEPEAQQRNPTAPPLCSQNSAFKHIALILLYWDS